MNILLTIAYDGTRYSGWQRQINGIAVQQRIEEALALTFEQHVAVIAASRTDAGVHALGQHVAFVVDDNRIPLDKIPYVINRHLPEDIVVRAAVSVPDGFNPRFRAKRKTYRYQIHNAPFPDPMLRRYSAFEPRTLDTNGMQNAAPLFMGRHDFKAFCASGSAVQSTVRTVYDCNVDFSADTRLITITVTGDGFLYNMVRILSGTLLYVGLGKFIAADIQDIIQSGERKRAGITMPPEGLTLMEVAY